MDASLHIQRSIHDGFLIIRFLPVSRKPGTYQYGTAALLLLVCSFYKKLWAIPHNSKCRYGERGAAAAKPKAQIILCVLSSILATQMPCRTPSRSEALRSATAACGGSWRGDPPERCLSRQAGIVRGCLSLIMLPRGPVLPDIRRTGPHLSCCRARRSRSADCQWSGPDYRTGS